MIIGTAGHIDHGKSRLVQALTGRAMDPLEEERRRGITIDLHFAPLPLPGGEVAGVVDVPGHEDLVRTMIAGAAGIDLVLLVIAADDGIMPQTREHLAIVEQLRVRAGIPVITKVDLVEPEWRALVAEEIAGWLARSPVRFTPPVMTSAQTAEGVDVLRDRIAETLGAMPVRDRDDLFRLPVDRSLSIPGVGTVVTGTAWSGSIHVGDQVRLFPSGRSARVRSLESHGVAVERSSPGQRLAVGLVGVEREAAARGSTLVSDGAPWQETSAIDVLAEVLPRAPSPLSHHTRVRVGLGTAEVLARVKLTDQMPPGRSGPVRLALERPLLCRGGDRIVLRRFSPVETLGGGRVVDPFPPRGRAIWSDGILVEEPAERLDGLLERRADGIPVAEVCLIAGCSPATVARVVTDSRFMVAHGHVLLRRDVEALSTRLGERLSEHHSVHPEEPGMVLQSLRGEGGGTRLVDAAVAMLLDAGRIALDGGFVRLAGFSPAVPDGEEVDLVVRLLEGAGLTPPTLAELGIGGHGLPEGDRLRQVLRLAERGGRLVAVERDRYFGVAALAGFRRHLAVLGTRGSITPAAVRDATGLSRKFAIPLLEWADREGLTRRDGDVRIWNGTGNHAPAGD